MYVKVEQFGEGKNATFSIVDADTGEVLITVTAHKKFSKLSFDDLVTAFRQILVKWHSESRRDDP